MLQLPGRACSFGIPHCQAASAPAARWSRRAGARGALRALRGRRALADSAAERAILQQLLTYGPRAEPRLPSIR